MRGYLKLIINNVLVFDGPNRLIDNIIGYVAIKDYFVFTDVLFYLTTDLSSFSEDGQFSGPLSNIVDVPVSMSYTKQDSYTIVGTGSATGTISQDYTISYGVVLGYWDDNGTSMYMTCAKFMFDSPVQLVTGDVSLEVTHTIDLNR